LIKWLRTRVCIQALIKAVENTWPGTNSRLSGARTSVGVAPGLNLAPRYINIQIGARIVDGDFFILLINIYTLPIEIALKYV